MIGLTVLAAIASLVAVAGVWLAVAAACGWPDPRRTTWSVARVRRWIGARRAHSSWRAVAVVAGAGVWALTGWPVLAACASLAAIGLPAILRAGSRASVDIERVEAVEEWARRVADLIAIGIGLEQAVQSSARTAPDAIADQVVTLAARIAARTPTEVALRAFADELDDPTADLVVAALILAARRRGPGVAAALNAIASSAAEEVAARRHIEADRAKPRTTARAVTVITLAIAVLGLLNRGYTDPYGTLLGQVVLAGTAAFFAAALWWMHSMTVTTRPARILDTAGRDL